MKETIIVIPAFEPEGKLVDFVGDLKEVGYEKIIVVDDGSGVEYRSIFSSVELMDVVVLHHLKNMGKGQALRTAFFFIDTKKDWQGPIITADADGQHLIKDIMKVELALEKYPQRLVLGIRDFDGENVPFKSRQGNKITKRYFKFITGVNCPDTQTGLRGIPKSMLKFALDVEGDRYEYEMNFLVEASKKTSFYYVPITTVYENNNACSHFRPVQDSLRIYGRPLRFLISSLTGASVDLLLFYLLTLALSFPHSQQILVATVVARVCSGIVNFFMNKHFSFKSRGKTSYEGVKYLSLFMGQMLLSAAGVSLLSMLLPNMAAKIAVDCLLFVLSYIIQKQWVFANERNMYSFRRFVV